MCWLAASTLPSQPQSHTLCVQYVSCRTDISRTSQGGRGSEMQRESPRVEDRWGKPTSAEQFDEVDSCADRRR